MAARGRSPVSRRSHKEPLECPDMLVQNALYTGDLAKVQKHFSEQAKVNLVFRAKKSHALRWTSHKWGKEDGGGQLWPPILFLPRSVKATGYTTRCPLGWTPHLISSVTSLCSSQPLGHSRWLPFFPMPQDQPP